MENSLQQYFEKERQNILTKCSKCGLCIRKCPILKHTELKNGSTREVQAKVIDFLSGGPTAKEVYTKSFACMECYKCVNARCPQGLNPLLINEIIKYDYRRKNLAPIPYTDPKNSNAKQRVLASIQVSAEEYKKIFNPSQKETAKYVFFPGCNVYLQPEKILSALDIMDMITDDYAFLPGMDYCCGNVYLEAGDVEKGFAAAQEIINKFSSYEPEAVILWCPTCYCRFITTIAAAIAIPFKFVSFTQFLADNMDKLPFQGEMNKTVTLHEACKMAYAGKDWTSPRKMLRGIPGVKLVEMPRHGADTVCCGSSAMDFFPQCMEVVRDERLLEAADTKAEILVDICQTCHNIFATEEPKYDYQIMNYVSLLAESLGIGREDKFKKYKQWGKLEKILEDADEFIKQSPYSRDEIIETLRKSIAPDDHK